MSTTANYRHSTVNTDEPANRRLNPPPPPPKPPAAAQPPRPAGGAGDPIRPSHYSMLPVDCPGCGRRIEAARVCEAMPSGWLFNTVKYLFRFQFKGKPLEDLRKARECLDREIQLREATEN
jgi:hypothetical protein